jgi:hypothetical protein
MRTNEPGMVWENSLTPQCLRAINKRLRVS